MIDLQLADITIQFGTIHLLGDNCVSSASHCGGSIPSGRQTDASTMCPLMNDTNGNYIDSSSHYKESYCHIHDFALLDTLDSDNTTQIGHIDDLLTSSLTCMSRN